jgi:hypothetical protein
MGTSLGHVNVRDKAAPLNLRLSRAIDDQHKVKVQSINKFTFHKTVCF